MCSVFPKTLFPFLRTTLAIGRRQNQKLKHPSNFFILTVPTQNFHTLCWVKF